MAATMFLQLRPKLRTIQNPRFIQFFSSSTPDPNSNPNPNPNVDDQNNPSSSQPQLQSQSSSFSSSYFSDVKASLKQQSPPQRRPRMPFSHSSPSHSNPNTSKVASLEEIRKNLSEFRSRSAVPFPDGKSSLPPPPPSQHISFQELYKRNVIAKEEDSNTNVKRGTNLSFEAIRESLKQLRPNQTTKNNQAGGGSSPMSLSNYRETLKLRPVDPNVKDSRIVIGDTENLPASVFAKEMRAKKESESSPETKTEFLKMYTYDELGHKLRKLRPEAKGENWFSLGELNERLKKLREVEEKESESGIGGVTFKDLRDSLLKLRMVDEVKAKKSSIQRLDVLGQFGATPNFMLAPPKEQLVEKYFHPDNMSSSEKLKLELQKVREEFKMSESDCGSARVQVATLTTKIKHLSTALHKKDKHSRKGLQEMVQRRKKLLKYLRRTDWDSYCLVLSKLGLRDNPNYKTKT